MRSIIGQCEDCCSCFQFKIFSSYSTRTALPFSVPDCPSGFTAWSDWTEFTEDSGFPYTITALTEATSSPPGCEYYISTEIRGRIEIRFLIPRAGTGKCYRVVLPVVHNRFGGDLFFDEYTTVETLCFTWDGITPEGYDPADPSTWPILNAPYTQFDPPGEAVAGVSNGVIFINPTTGDEAKFYCTCTPCP